MSSIHSELVEAWKAAGIEEGDTVLLHSNARRMIFRLMRMDRTVGAGDIVLALLDAVDHGTVLFPTFSFEFAKGKPFEAWRTPSEMGLLSEEARSQAGLCGRSGHPIY